jgi:hypothetical protein
MDAGTHASKAGVSCTSRITLLCLHEAIVPVSREDELPDTYQLLSVDLSNDLIEPVKQNLLAEDWRFDPTITQRIGNTWLLEGRSAGLLVPLVTVTVPHNCWFNPHVTAVTDLRLEVVGRFPFDARLPPTKTMKRGNHIVCNFRIL